MSLVNLNLPIRAIDMTRPPRFGDVFRWRNNEPLADQPVVMFVSPDGDSQYLGAWVGINLQMSVTTKTWTALDTIHEGNRLSPNGYHWVLIEEGPA